MKTWSILKVGAIALFICTIIMMPQSGECGIKKIAKGAVNVVWKGAKYCTYPVWKPPDLLYYKVLKPCTERGRKLRKESRGKHGFQVYLSYDGQAPIWPGFIPIRRKGAYMTAVSSQPQGWRLKAAWLERTKNGKPIKTKIPLGSTRRGGVRKTNQVKIGNRADNSTDFSWVVKGLWIRDWVAPDEHGEPQWNSVTYTGYTYGYYAKYYKGRKGR